MRLGADQAMGMVVGPEAPARCPQPRHGSVGRGPLTHPAGRTRVVPALQLLPMSLMLVVMVLASRTSLDG